MAIANTVINQKANEEEGNVFKQERLAKKCM